MKRTHGGCNTVFDAKNDWKRHENSQHHQLKRWKYDIDIAASLLLQRQPLIHQIYAGNVSFTKPIFVKHLKMVHGNVNGWWLAQLIKLLPGNYPRIILRPRDEGSRDMNQGPKVAVQGIPKWLFC